MRHQPPVLHHHHARHHLRSLPALHLNNRACTTRALSPPLSAPPHARSRCCFTSHARHHRVLALAPYAPSTTGSAAPPCAPSPCRVTRLARHHQCSPANRIKYSCRSRARHHQCPHRCHHPCSLSVCSSALASQPRSCPPIVSDTAASDTVSVPSPLSPPHAIEKYHIFTSHPQIHSVGTIQSSLPKRTVN